MGSIWCAIESLPSAAAAVTWQRWLGPSLPAVAAAWLRRTDRRAQRLPCVDGCGCGHRVVPAGDGFLGICDCGEGCEDLRLTAKEVEVWELPLGTLGRAVAKAFGCHVKLAELGLPRTLQIASFGSCALPVMLTIPADSEGLGQVVAQLVAQQKGPFILLAPTNRFLLAPARALLAGVKAGFFDLESHVSMTAQGNLQARKRAAELFARFLPEEKEPLPEDVARRAFQLIEQLDSEQVIKPPSVLAVFRLYCVKELTAERVARKCRCSKGTVINRLKLIREKTGMNPDELRRFSSHFDKIEDDIRESKAAYVHRKRMIEDNPSEEAGE